MTNSLRQGIPVEIESVAKQFRVRGQELPALIDVSMSIRPGQFVSLVGPSGCGKSTLLRLVAGLDSPSSGQIRVNDIPVVGPSQTCGVVFQRPALFPWFDVTGNVTFGPRMQRRDRRETQRLAKAYLEAVGLQGFEHHKVYELSGGMQHRVALARVLINRPTLLLMDEPFGALDAQTRLIMQELLLHIWEADRSTVLFITHDVDEALLLSDRVVLMTARPGRIKADYQVNLPRPRSLSLITSAEFVTSKAEILHSIREEILKTSDIEQRFLLGAPPRPNETLELP